MRVLIGALAIAGLLLFGVSTARALCLDTGTAPFNQCEFDVTGKVVPNFTFAGRQGASACYGSITVVGSAFKVGWTVNGNNTIAHYNCTLSVPGLSGPVWVNVFRSDPHSAANDLRTCALSVACPLVSPSGGAVDVE